MLLDMPYQPGDMLETNLSWLYRLARYGKRIATLHTVPEILPASMEEVSQDRALNRADIVVNTWHTDERSTVFQILKGGADD